MGTYIIKMPDIGEGIAEVELVDWHVKPGDMVAEEQVLADVMTDKASVEIPSHVAGKVVALTGKPGDVIAVGSEIIRLEVEGKGNVEDAAAAPAKVAAAPAPSPGPKPAPAAPKPAPAPQSKPAPAPTLSLASSRAEPRSESERPLAAPAVRRRAREMGVDLAGVSGSGPDGRITQEDLDGLGSRGNALRFAVPGGGKIGVARHGEESVAVIGLRRKIAEKMQDSKRRIPHFTYVEEVDVTALEEARAQLNARWKSERGHLTMLPFLMHAMARTLPDYPEVNARFDDDGGTLTKYGAVHIGIATQTPNGLMVPVVRNAEARDLWSCASEVARLAEAARNGKASREELTGSTITITSLGPLGGIVTTPVINYPEVAIVGVNKVVERPVVREGLVVVRKVMNLSSSFDHRIVDGLRAAQFVQGLKAYLEAPSTLFVD
ncbi:MAG TPA: dihydrolipoamide acetyltransferase family protein [Usitatibacter sp.]|nr:dihydrolipoamide acetyltransferase family protein [Usitatibacter sp.]